MDENGDLVDLRQCSRLLSHRVLEISIFKCVCGAGVESSSGNMDENGDLVDLRQRSGLLPHRAHGATREAPEHLDARAGARPEHPRWPGADLKELPRIAGKHWQREALIYCFDTCLQMLGSTEPCVGGTEKL